MILQSAELSAAQKAAIEETVGRKLLDHENVVVCCGKPKVASADIRQQAADQMRYQLYLLDRSQRRTSIEDYAAALLGDSEAN